MHSKLTRLNQFYFNSQPHEEADNLINTCVLVKTHFNSQPHEEADNYYANQDKLSHRNFNSQPHEEADKYKGQLLPFVRNFNSQPHEEADFRPLFSGVLFQVFQLTASRRG